MHRAFFNGPLQVSWLSRSAPDREIPGSILRGRERMCVWGKGARHGLGSVWCRARVAGVRVFCGDGRGLDRVDHRLVLLRRLRRRLLLQDLWPVAWARSEPGSKGCVRAGLRACGLARGGQGASGVLTTGAPRAGAQGMRASRASRLARGQRCAIGASSFPEKSFFQTIQFECAGRAPDTVYY